MVTAHLSSRCSGTDEPHPNAAIEYALDDVRYLFRLKDELFGEIDSALRVERLAIELVSKAYSPDSESRRSRKRENMLQRLGPTGRRVHDRIEQMRDGVAMIEDCPPHNVIPNKEILSIVSGDIDPLTMTFSKSVRPEFKSMIRLEIGRLMATVGTK